jgi:hypothetical protein
MKAKLNLIQKQFSWECKEGYESAQDRALGFVRRNTTNGIKADANSWCPAHEQH